MVKRPKRKGPGRSYRKGLSVIELLKMFPDDEAAEKWFEECRWPNGERFCPDCGSVNYSVSANRKPMPYRCRDCKNYFSVRKGSVMQYSKIGIQKWVIAIFMLTTGIKGISSMRVYRELGLPQKTAWFMMQRIREAFMTGNGKKLPGPIEVDETYIGGREKNKHWKKKANNVPYYAGKAIVIGARSQKTGKVQASVILSSDHKTLINFIKEVAEPGTKVYTDFYKAYKGMRGFRHDRVKHAAGEYYRKGVTTNGIESFWSGLKRGYKGVYHKMSPKHLNRYVQEFVGRNNIRDLDTVEQMEVIAVGLIGKRLRYGDLIRYRF